MSALAVYLFQCVTTETFAFSLYRSANDLPAGVCQGTWRYKGELSMTFGSLVSLPIDAPAVLRDLQCDGYAIVRLSSTLIIFPKRREPSSRS